MLPYFLEGLPAFVAYFALGSLLLSAFGFVYIKLTAHDEIALIRAGNISAAIAFGATLLGLGLPIASAIANTMSIVAAGTWSLIGCIVQIGAYGVGRILIPDLSERIDKDDRAAATTLAAVSLAAAMLNAACMTY
jgi:putative membrane protein